MVKNKKIILSFLFLAWTIIFAHSIIPHHHHHSDFISIKKTHCHNDHHHDSEHHHHDDFSITSEFDCCEDHDSEHTCHFHVKVLTQISIDHVFISTTENSLFSNLVFIEASYENFYSNFISEEFPKTNYLRGPPSVNA